MNHERRRQIMQVLEAAQELAAGERHAFLDNACAGDQALRREVESLLVADGKANRFMAGPAMQDVARGLAEQADALGDSYATTMLETQAVSLASGVLLDGRYLIERELGRGGIGIVFLARDQRLRNRPVVVKALLEQRLNGEARDWFEKKFRDEISALALIEDPGVVHPLDVGQLADGRFYLVMEYVAGQPLSQIISPGGLALPRVARLLRQIARALVAAHDKGVIHRDLTPRNILLQNAGAEAEQIKLIDFGLATVRDVLTASAPLTTMVAGTPPYMAPEQMRGKPEKASDIYALGVLAYQMVTGRLPFTGKSITEIAEAQQAGIKTLPCEWRPDLPLAAQAAILRALAFESAERYDNPTAFSEDFQRALAEEPEADPYQTSAGLSLLPIPPKARLGRWLLGSGILAAVLLSALAWRFLLPIGEKSVPVVITPATKPVAAERALSYSLLAKKKASHDTFAPASDTVFAAGDLLRLTLSSPQPGYLYLFSEARKQANQPYEMVALFPNTIDNGGLARLNANQVVQLPPGEHWWDFSPGQEEEKLWLVWAEQSVPELDANPKDVSALNRRRSEAMRQFLDAHAITELKTAPDEAHPQLKLTGKETVLVGRLKLARR